MDEAEGILLGSLNSSGVSLPAGISSLKGLTPDALVSICAQSLRLINDGGSSFSFATSLPDSTADRFKVCADMASALQSLGFRDDLSFHQFLYPSDEYSYNVVRFIVEKLLEYSEGKNVDSKKAAIYDRKEVERDLPEESRNCERVSCFDGEHDTLRENEKENVKELSTIESRRACPTELESQWNAHKTLEERKMTDEQSLHPLKPDVEEKLHQLRAVQQETEEIIAEIHKREVEHAELLLKLEKQPKVPSRRSYIEQVTEITKNSWKQDADIKRILQETRELQLESNSIQERLHRTYAVVDEMVFREAKKDAVGRQVYRLLTSIHDSFEQIAAKILASDRARREAANQEAKFAASSSCNFDINKLQSDLDSIRRENEFLELQSLTAISSSSKVEFCLRDKPPGK